MSPVGQQGSDKYIGHAGQKIRLWQQLCVIADAIEQDGLGTEDKKSEDGIYKGGMSKAVGQSFQDK